ncbi:hypothetical protein RHSIM_Rhsim01G0270700 [Rhododendron simsii]|uniref:3-ketoacyl-CoA synthase n=1 Tax=Rhododendron simsii TaxID=118357 RepID=A0A834HHC4_RHOSS|nr:hypothetical protein RHSIM_Rhsim01G0270700 [Rhododendron simsii]
MVTKQKLFLLISVFLLLSPTMFSLSGSMNLALTQPLWLTLTIIIISFFLLTKNPPPKQIYMLDFACYKPPPAQAITKQGAVARARVFNKLYKEETLAFMRSTIERSGLGDSTYFPEAFLKDPPDPDMEAARAEAEMAIFGAVGELLAKTKVKSRDIGIVVVNCCIFCAVPSLSSMIVNRYKMKEGVVSYNLSGMGCAAGLIAINLAKQLLQVHHDSYALVVSTESITENCYKGNDRSKFLINCLFRVGGAAILLSNRKSDRRSSKYQLLHAIPTHTASFDRCYNCIVSEEDTEGHAGVTITKDLLAAAITAIESNITSLAPLVLPASEQARYLLNHVARRLPVANAKPYVPDFKKSFDHFLPHVGGKPVLDELQRSLRLTKSDMEASRMTLFRFGNTSSSSVWYELAYVEAKGRIKRGDRVWQMAFGSGFKCCSVVWRAIRTVDDAVMNPWSDEIDGFPVDLNNNAPFPYFFEPSKSK